MHASVRPAAPLLWTSKSIQKHLKYTVWALFLAHLWRDDGPGRTFMTLHWWLNMGPVAVVENAVKPIVLNFFVKKGAPGASTHGTPKTKSLQTIRKIKSSDSITGPMLDHQWKVIKTLPGSSSHQRGAKKSAQTVCFEWFWTFSMVHTK